MDKNSILKFFFPPKCMFCGEVLAAKDNCQQCNDKIKHLKIEEHAREIKHNCFKNIDKCISCYYYKDEIRDSILYAKFKSCGSFVEEFLNYTDFDFADFCRQNNIDEIISMPAHKSKFYTQEYDLPQQMAKQIVKRYKLKYNKDLVIKIKKTENQHELGLAQRKENLKGAFVLGEQVKGKNILIMK